LCKPKSEPKNQLQLLEQVTTSQSLFFIGQTHLLSEVYESLSWFLKSDYEYEDFLVIFVV